MKNKILGNQLTANKGFLRGTATNEARRKNDMSTKGIEINSLTELSK